MSKSSFTNLKENTIVKQLGEISVNRKTYSQKCVFDYAKRQENLNSEELAVSKYWLAIDAMKCDLPIHAANYLLDAMAYSRFDVNNYYRALSGFEQLADMFLAMVEHHPEKEELSHVYGVLCAVGEAGFDHHLGAIAHFNAAGRHREAYNIYKALKFLYPNYPLFNNTDDNLENKEPEFAVAEPVEMLKLHRYLNTYRNVLKAYSYEDSQEMIRLCDGVLQDNYQVNDQNRIFWFYKALGLSNSGNSVEAIPIFYKLSEKYPNHPEYNNAIESCLRNVAYSAMELFRKDPKSEKLEVFCNILHNHWRIPCELMEYWAFKTIKTNKNIVKSKLLTLLRLYFGDEDYIRLNFLVAQKIGDKAWLKALDQHVASMIRIYPFRLELYQFLPKEDKYKNKNLKLVH